MTQHHVIDDKDMRILYLLDTDARISNAELAKKAGLSGEVARYRVHRLEKDGIIKSYFTLIDVSKLGFTSFRIYLKILTMPPGDERRFTQYLQDRPDVGWFTFVQGQWDLVIVMWARDIYGFEKFWLDFVEKYGMYIERHWMSIFLQYVHFNKRFLLPKEAELKVYTVGQSSREKIDELDWRILKALSEDARCPLLALQKRLGQSYKVIAYRIRRMERKGIILGYRAFIDFSKIGFNYYKVLFSLHNVNLARLAQLEQRVTSLPNVVYIDKTIGGADFEAEFQCRGGGELRAIQDGLRREFTDLIRNTETMEYYHEKKLCYLPPVFDGEQEKKMKKKKDKMAPGKFASERTSINHDTKRRMKSR
jgi:Lrp/AsnC family transcriptional regulator, leucine-responsive regulatory protein